MNPIAYRIEDIIAMAKDGKKTEAEVILHKVPVTMKVHPDAEISEEQQGFLYNGEFKFRAGREEYNVTKTYIRTFATDSVETARSNRNIVNARLKEDYQRLKKAGIPVEEKYFDKARVF